MIIIRKCMLKIMNSKECPSGMLVDGVMNKMKNHHMVKVFKVLREPLYRPVVILIYRSYDQVQTSISI